MNSSRRHLAAIALAALASTAALAQPKPNNVQDRDEPGRNPWQQTVSIQQNETNCPGLFQCLVQFDAVPAGKRLVVTHASAVFSATTDAAEPLVRVGPFATPHVGPFLPLPQSRGERYLASGPVLFYVEEGQRPLAAVQAFILNDGGQTQVVLSGYFVNLP